MDSFAYRDGRLFCEGVAVDDLLDRAGSPAYIYSKETFLRHYDALTSAFAELEPIICYSIKSCGNLNIVKMLAERGCGMDVVSGGELFRARRAGADMRKVVYAGVGKTDPEIEAGIKAGIGWFNIESEAEFENVAAIARRLGKQANGALRVNPDVYDAKTHAKTTTGKKETKFGVDIERAKRFFESYGHHEHCRLTAIHLHIGSPIYSPDPYVQAITKAIDLIDGLRADGYTVDTLDIGGGYAADYESGKSPAYTAYADAIVPLVRGKHLRIIIEPGRTISGNAGVLACRVQYIKTGGSKTFAIVDTGMHHLIRPSFYEGFHFAWPTRVKPEHVPAQRAREMNLTGLQTYDVVGPICETSDTLATARNLPPLKRGDGLCFFTAGAYGMAMASNYNTRPRAAEVMIVDGAPVLVREREQAETLFAGEKLLA